MFEDADHPAIKAARKEHRPESDIVRSALTELDNAMLDLIRQGRSDREVARRVGGSHKIVGRVRREAGIPVYIQPPPIHGTNARWKRGCRCGPCVQARALAKAIARRQHSPSLQHQTFNQELSKRLTAMHRVDQEETRAKATASNQRWSENDLKVAADYSKSAVQVAQELGRSLSAVRHVRRKYKMNENITNQAVVLPYGPRAKRA